MTDAVWKIPHVRYLGVRLAGDDIDEVDDRGRPIVDDTLLLLLNAHDQAVIFHLPSDHRDGEWAVEFDTDQQDRRGRRFAPGSVYDLRPRSLVVLVLTADGHAGAADALSGVS
jgi:glycogen operon protein